MVHLWEGCLPWNEHQAKIPLFSSQETQHFSHSPFSIKGSLKSNSGKMALCDAGPPSSRSADFLNKVTIPCPNNLSLYLLACHVVSSTSLDSVTPWARCTQPINTVQLAKRSRKKKAASHGTEINTKAIFYSSLLNGLVLRAPTSKHAISHQVRLS